MLQFLCTRLLKVQWISAAVSKPPAHPACLHVAGVQSTNIVSHALLCCGVLPQAAAFFPPHQAHLTAAMLRWSAASMWAVKALVRPKEGQALREELKGRGPACWLL